MRLSLASLIPASTFALGTFGLVAALATPAAAQTATMTCECGPAVAPAAPMPPMAMGVGPGGMAGGVVMMPVAAPVERWRQNRFGVGLRFGGMSIEDKAMVEEEQQFSTGGLMVRYRASRRLELELTLEHGTQQIEGEGGERYETDLELGTATAALLIHMRPEARWDWYLLGGLGVNDRRFKGDPDELADTRGHLALGVGLERRWEHLVLGVELRALAIGPRQEQDDDVRIAAQLVKEEEEGLGGGQLSFSAGWFF